MPQQTDLTVNTGYLPLRGTLIHRTLLLYQQLELVIPPIHRPPHPLTIYPRLRGLLGLGSRRITLGDCGSCFKEPLIKGVVVLAGRKGNDLLAAERLGCSADWFEGITGMLVGECVGEGEGGLSEGVAQEQRVVPPWREGGPIALVHSRLTLELQRNLLLQALLQDPRGGGCSLNQRRGDGRTVYGPCLSHEGDNYFIEGKAANQHWFPPK